MIPYAGGLEEELLKRIEGTLSFSFLCEEMAPDNLHKITKYNILVDEEILGTLEISTYAYRDIERVDHINYRGRIPGYCYGATGEDEVSMTATEKPSLEIRHFEYMNLSEPNNTFSNPLFRHDGHPLRLANSEVDGRERTALREQF